LLYYKSENLNTILLLLFASIGNTIGSIINYLLGKYATDWAIKKSYIKSLHVEKSKTYFDKYGAFALLLAWVPIVGDPITFVAGVLRYNFIIFCILVVISKLSRYAFLLYLYDLFI